VLFRSGDPGLPLASAQGRFTSVDPLLASGKPGSPQSWNRYAYVGNNPLASVDPNGMLALPSEEDQQRQRPPQPPQQPRIVYIFVTFTQAEQERTIKPDDATPEFTAVAAPDFQSLVNNAPAGTNVKLVTGADATLEAFTNALQDPNAAGVFFIGHGSDNEYPTSPFTADGISLADEVFEPDEPVQVKAQTVGIFACDSQAVRGSFQMGSGQGYIGVDSGKNGLTSTNALSQAGFSAAKTVIGRGTPDAAAAAAHGALTKASSAGTFRAPGGTNVDARAAAMNAGDRVRRVP